jgi:hypothetical protein
VKLAQWLRCALDFAFEAFESGQLPAVADLPAALAVERRLVEQQLDGLADLGTFDALAFLDDR